ncbi:meiosis regulator and mRNA stability factor 1 [Eurytemora carolleeae]|uniref:meiosis regulator and mRNA stability factor 1 n=1 Tax=Eurytemora carolleeae TaxID=1294199 RepID=UPI000C793163|nr:meiosis regulator and mRNA stability factor 1 [Eurytemora carolleeae]|eukprot:XP_023328012.1 meiosis regulator and mRNA stability factor 1-like [Eurytemora affinis]
MSEMSWSQLCGDFNDNNSPKLQQVEDYSNCSLSNNDEEIILKELDLNKLDDHSSGVELQITNLDRSIPPEQMRKILILQFREFVTVKELNISFLSDGKPQAIVKLENQQSAQLAIFRLHRKKLGHKRIYLAYRTKISLSSLKSKVASVLLSIPGGRIHLMKFRELYDKRFNSSIRITDLHQMKDLLYIIEDISGKIIQFNPNITAVDKLKGLESFYCCKHSPAKNLGDDDVSSKPLFYLNISLKDVSCDINLLLKEHDGRIPLSSLSDCYQHMFPEREQEGDQAVPLLHLITCIKGVKVIKDESAMKSLVEISVQALTPAVNVEEVYSQQLANQFSLLSRELVDLLKTWPGCRMPFNKFIPAFHHYFGRQCRVADYGFTKLRDLFEAMPHVVHVLGEGSKAVITLSKKAQIRRFTSDIQKILKLEPEKHVLLSDLPMKFVTVYSRPFKISDYGVCNVSDMLEMLPEKTFKISFIRENKLKGILQIGAEEENMIIALPRGIQGGDLILCYLGNFLMDKGGGECLCNSPINGDPDMPSGFHYHRELIGARNDFWMCCYNQASKVSVGRSTDYNRDEVETFSDIYRFHRRKHMCLWIEAEDHAFQNGGVDGHTWARRYVDPLRVNETDWASLAGSTYR